MNENNPQTPQQNPQQNQHSQPDYSQPVAYDTNGRPLYAHPPQHAQSHDQHPGRPQIVQLTRPMEPVAPHISEEALERHKRSVQAYPYLNLSEGEYIISAVRRHPIGLIGTIGIGGLVIFMLVFGVAAYATIQENAAAAATMPSVAVVFLIALLIGLLTSVFTFIGVYVYMNNKFFLTNESVIQEIQHSLFSKHEQTVSLANIEDASFQQHGILQHLVNYGSIRLSTEGDETTYRFNYVSNPKKQIAILNNAVEAFKNGRPVDFNDN